MAELNVSLILRMVDRLSAPARAASLALAGIGRQASSGSKAAETFGKATSAATAATARFSKAAELGTAALGGATVAAQAGAGAVAALTAATGAGVDVASTAARAADRLAASNSTAGDAAERAARRFGMLERAQIRGRAATRMLGSEFGRLNTRLGHLAMGSIATSGMERAGRTLFDPMKRSVEAAAGFQKGMTGIGILGDLAPSQLAVVQSNILASAQRLAIPIAAMQQDDMAVLNEGVYRRGPDLVQASQSAAKLSLLADIGGAPITGTEAGALVATYAHSMLAPAKWLDRLNATLFRASQLGGDKMGDVARFMPEVMGQMKGRAFGNYQGFVDANAAFQIAKRVAGSDEAAGVDVKELMLNLNHMLTDRRFKKAGLDLEAIIAKANTVGVSRLTAALDAIMAKIGTSSTDPGLSGKLGKFFMNAEAQQAALAIVTNQRDTAAGPGWNTLRRLIADPSSLTNYYGAIQKASQGPYADLVRLANAQQQIAISTGKILFPALNKLAIVMTKLADLMTGFEAHGGLVAKAAVYGASGIGLLALGAGALGNAVVGVLGPLWIASSLFGRILPLAATSACGGLAGLSARFVAATGAAGVLDGGVMTLATGALPALGAALRSVAVAVLADPATWPIVAGVVAIAGGALLVRKYWQPISAFFGGVWSGVAEGLRPLERQLGGLGRSVAPYLSLLRSAGGALVGKLGAAWTSLIAPVRLTAAQFHNAAEAGRRFGLILGETASHVGSLLALLNPLRGGLVGVGVDLMGGLIKGILRMGPMVHRTITHVGDQVVAWFKGRLGIHSPSAVFAALGDQTIAGLSLGLRRSEALPLRRLRALSEAMTLALTASVLPVSIAVAHPALPPPGLSGQVASAGLGRSERSLSARPPPPTPREVHHHHTYRMTFNVEGRHDAKAVAKEIDRLRRRTVDAALHDGGDDL